MILLRLEISSDDHWSIMLTRSIFYALLVDQNAKGNFLWLTILTRLAQLNRY
jgi:hypothetical protein